MQNLKKQKLSSNHKKTRISMISAKIIYSHFLICEHHEQKKKSFDSESVLNRDAKRIGQVRQYRDFAQELLRAKLAISHIPLFLD